MTPSIENVELKSEKVRNIIGQIPPRIVRMGISVIFLVIIGLVLIASTYRYDLAFGSRAIIWQRKGTTIIQVIIPANEIAQLKSGNKVILNFKKMPNLNNFRVVTEIQMIPNELHIEPSGGFYRAEITIDGKLINDAGVELFVDAEIELDAEVYQGKTSFLDKIIETLRSVKKNFTVIGQN